MTVFTGLRVLEFSTNISGQYCAKLLADLGAEVIKAEEPKVGDWTRRRGPFLNDEPHSEGSGLFLYLNTNKLGITINPEVPAGRETFLKLARECDVLIDGQSPGLLAQLGLDYDVLREVNPRLIMAAVSPWGQTGPYRDFKAYSLNSFHAGGEGFVLPGGLSHDLFPDREPVKAPGYVGDFDGGVAAATAVVAALIWRSLDGGGQYIDISVQEALLQLSRVEIERFAGGGELEDRGTRYFPGGLGLVRANDGYALLQANNEAVWEALVEFMGSPEWAKQPEFQDSASRVEHGAEVRANIQEWARNHDKDYIYHEGQAAGIVTAAVYTTEDLFDSPQIKAREFLIELDHRYSGKLKYPSAPYKFSETPAVFSAAAPLLGQHNRQIYADLLGYSDSDLQTLEEEGAL